MHVFFVATHVALLLLCLVGPVAATQEDPTSLEPADFAKTICGEDDLLWAACYELSEPDIFTSSRAVARLKIGEGIFCTGWLIGSEGHLLTNNHCIADAQEAAATQVEFEAQGQTCETDCSGPESCPGVLADDPLMFIKGSASLDYSLLKLPASYALPPRGYLRLRKSGGIDGERVYIPQHPLAQGKLIAVSSDRDDSEFVEIRSEPDHQPNGRTVWFYFGDTDSGSSGSPVIAYSDHQVVALNSDGDGLACELLGNFGTIVEEIIAHLGDDLPKDAVHHRLTVALNDASRGQVTSNPAGILCGDVNTECEMMVGHRQTVTLNAAPFAGFILSHWSGDPDCTDGEIFMDEDIVCTAHFVPSYFLILSKQGNGDGSIIATVDKDQMTCSEATCFFKYAEGTTVTLTPDPVDGSQFTGWTGDADCADGSVLMDSLKSCTAEFQDPTTLTINFLGDGEGSVVTSPATQTCFSLFGSCVIDLGGLPIGVMIQLFATPEAGSVFEGWGGDCAGGPIQVPGPGGDLKCTVTFTPEQHQLQVSIQGAGSCMVTSDPGDIDCGADCAENYPYGTIVALNSTGDHLSWLGSADCLDGVVTMTENISCVAECTPSELVIFIDGFESGTITWSESEP